MTQGYQNHTNMLAYTLHKYKRHCQNIHSCTEGSVARKKDAHRHTTVLSPAKFPPKADIPVLHNQQSAVFAMCCSVPLSVSTAASAGCELLTLWTPSHTYTHAHAKSPHTGTQTHRHTHAITVGESGFGVVTFYCLSSSGPRPRQLAPPLTLPDFAQPSPFLSNPVIMLQLLSNKSQTSNWLLGCKRLKRKESAEWGRGGKGRLVSARTQRGIDQTFQWEEIRKAEKRISRMSERKRADKQSKE